MNGLSSLQSFLIEEELDAALIISPTNLQYFAGFTGTTGLVLVTPTEAYMYTDSRYIEQARNECVGYEVIQHRSSVFDTLRDHIIDKDIPIRTCCFEGTTMSVETYMRLTDVLENIEFVGLNFATLRIIKNEMEIECLKKAFSIADEAFAATLGQLKVGMTENEARIILECEMLRRGSLEPSFTTIVASGYRSSMPHGVASDKVMEEGDFVTFDFGAVYKGYHSDMTRTIVLGKASDEQKEIYATVLEAQTRGVNGVKAGLSGKDLDKICRDYIQEKGYGAYFGHGTGHGVGLDIHELPVASPSSEDILEPNMVVTVEPGIYIPGKMGVRIEDTVIVTLEGCHVLTTTPKDLLELDV